MKQAISVLIEKIHPIARYLSNSLSSFENRQHRPIKFFVRKVNPKKLSPLFIRPYIFTLNLIFTISVTFRSFIRNPIGGNVIVLNVSKRIHRTDKILPTIQIKLSSNLTERRKLTEYHVWHPFQYTRKAEENRLLGGE